MKKILPTLISSLLTSILCVGLYHYSGLGNQVIKQSPSQVHSYATKARLKGTQEAVKNQKFPPDFTEAAGRAMPSVVHISSIQTRYHTQSADPFFNFFGYDFFDGRASPQEHKETISTGSGVIVDAEGYIVTNNHVIQNAEEIEVSLYDNRNYKAVVVGVDPSTDLAVLKIEEEGLPVIELSDSDEAKVGEWVLAVGNPFNLSSTVTAGIVSAIGRNLEIIKDRMAIESFIQTDAAVNPGNSGGALVNLDGKLLGINTAIATPTGSYAGYSFAVPANIVQKVVEDLKNYGVVQRGFLGIGMRNVDGNLADKMKLPVTEGVYIAEAISGGSAKEAGLDKGDVIVQIDGLDVKNAAKLQELIGRHRPGDNVKVTVVRNSRYKEFDVLLKDEFGNMHTMKKEHSKLMNQLGLDLRGLTPKESRVLGVEGGVRVTHLYAGKIRQQTRIKEGYIILKINNKTVSSVEDFAEIMLKQKGKVRLAGIYPGYWNLYYYEFDV